MKQCTCIYEPKGDHGLEGFILDEAYDFEKKGELFVVYLDYELQDNGVMTKTTFNKYFRKEKTNETTPASTKVH